MLLYTFRLFERQFGSRKFGGCIFYLLSCSTVLQVVIQLFSRGFFASQGGRNWYFSSGPYGMAFGLLAMFFWDIPQTVPFTVFGTPLSDKMFVYLLGVQLALASPAGSAYTALIGIILGALYLIDYLPLHRLRVPHFLFDGCGRLFAPLLSASVFDRLTGVDARAGRRVGGSGRLGGSTPAAARMPQQPEMGAGMHSPGGYVPVGGSDADQEGEVLNEMAYLGGIPPAAAYAPVEPSPGAVAQLVSMGFTEERSRAALQATRNDLNAATNRLLGL